MAMPTISDLWNKAENTFDGVPLYAGTGEYCACTGEYDLHDDRIPADRSMSMMAFIDDRDMEPIAWLIVSIFYNSSSAPIATIQLFGQEDTNHIIDLAVEVCAAIQRKGIRGKQ